MKILLGLTGSVASTLYLKLIDQLSVIGEVDVILTEKSKYFVDVELLKKKVNRVYQDSDEWTNTLWNKEDGVLHIDLRNKYGTLVVAPCGMNTLSKIATGQCDNLLTSVIRAWDNTRLKVLVPAANTHMWEHPVTQEHIEKLQSWGWVVVPPQEKVLACKTMGMGAMADISLIVDIIKDRLRWHFPIWNDICKGIPVGEHQGAFNAKRKYSIHTGVDMYVPVGTWVQTVEDGRIVCIEKFTGPNDKSPWWLDTDCVLVEGTSGVVCYGEIKPQPYLHVGQLIKRGEPIGKVLAVLPESKFRPDIDGHMVSMLHMELYPHGRYKPSDGYEKDKGDLRDPTPFLMNANGAPEKTFVHPKPISYKNDDLWDADPNCEHNVICAPGGGVKCTKCSGWFCY